MEKKDFKGIGSGCSPVSTLFKGHGTMWISARTLRIDRDDKETFEDVSLASLLMKLQKLKEDLVIGTQEDYVECDLGTVTLAEIIDEETVSAIKGK